jgi:hypothetical protein
MSALARRAVAKSLLPIPAPVLIAEIRRGEFEGLLEVTKGKHVSYSRELEEFLIRSMSTDDAFAREFRAFMLSEAYNFCHRDFYEGLCGIAGMDPDAPFAS